MHQNFFSAVAPPWTPLEELTTLPRPPSGMERRIPPPHCLPSDQHLRHLDLGASIDSTATSTTAGWRQADLAEVLKDDGDVHVDDDKECHDEVRDEVDDGQPRVAAVAVRPHVCRGRVAARRRVVH